MIPEFICKKCGGKEFGFFDDYGREYNYCLICNTAYDEEGNMLVEGDTSDPEEERLPYYQDPDKERDQKDLL